MKDIVVLQGGNSPEREVSLTSAKAVTDELRRLGYQVTELDPSDFPVLGDLLTQLDILKPDMIFNALHGGTGENGEIQALLELTGYSFTGSAAKACVLTMDKYVCKLIVREEGIPVPDSVLMRYDMLSDYNDPSDYQGFVDKLSLPLIVKPVDAG
ncbi:MAG TPA: D-alanine--D-alanine ligase, partial [Candidatus Cloacimonadota bacterium]|nr:D-alanine--D-alanine ligase [Candidatus Cloacimonadota bacterium]